MRETLDQLRERYVELYEESEAISRSSVVAAEIRVRRNQQQRIDELQRNGASAPEPRLSDRIPHRVRAAVPASLRGGVRRALGRER